MTQIIKAVIFDWAGTTVDYGCFAPVQAFVSAFSQKGIVVTNEEVRKPMGLLKIDHIKTMLAYERIAKQWLNTYGKAPDAEDVLAIYHCFEQELMSSLEQYTDPTPGTLALIKQLRQEGIKIGSTTGYTKEMMNVVAYHAAIKGYKPDFLVCGDELEKGRPYPYMIHKNMEQLQISSPQHVLKVGDTLSDIEEGKNAGTWTVGVIKGGNELGLTEDEVNALSLADLEQKMNDVRMRYKAAGADFIIDEISDVWSVIQEINRNGA